VILQHRQIPVRSPNRSFGLGRSRLQSSQLASKGSQAIYNGIVVSWPATFNPLLGFAFAFFHESQCRGSPTSTNNCAVSAVRYGILITGLAASYSFRHSF